MYNYTQPQVRLLIIDLHLQFTMKGIRNDKTRLVSLSFTPWDTKRTFLPK